MTRHLRRDRWPERPDDLDPQVSPLLLLGVYQRHLLVLAAARSGSSPELPATTAARAVAALAIAHAVVADLSEERWPIVRDALVHGASRAQVSAATGGLEADELAAGLTAWADRRLGAGRMGGAEHRAVLALVGARLPGVLRGTA